MNALKINRLAVLVFVGAVFVAFIATGQDTNSFPAVDQVLGDRIFPNKFAREVFFLQQIRQRYPQFWPSLLAANITPGNYIVTPEKLVRFVEQVGVAGENTDDPIAITSVAAIVTNADFYTNSAQPEVQQAVVSTLNQIGPKGRLALANAFSQDHYQTDPESLETLADAVGKSGLSDSNLLTALAATAFTYATSSGAFYPNCTQVAVRNLLCLTNGPATVRVHLNTNELFKDPGRFQSVVDAIAGSHADALATNLDELDTAITARLPKLLPNPYRDDLTNLQARIQQTMKDFRQPTK